MSENKRVFQFKKDGIEGFTEVDIQACNDVETLKTWKLQVEDELSSIKLQITAAKMRAAAGEGYSAPDWFIRAQDAHRIMGRLTQKINARLGQLNKQEKQERTGSFERHFVEVSRLYLPDNIYNQIFKKAQELALASLPG